MPSSATITAYYTFQANTKARSTQVNANFSLYRGHLVPIEPLTATAADLTYDLGSTEYRWRTSYLETVDLSSSTTTASLQMKGNVLNTFGAFEFYIGGALKGRIFLQGIDGATIAPDTVDPVALTKTPTLVLYETSGSFVAPDDATRMIIVGCGGGGGGGAGAGASGDFGGGGGGGGGAPISVVACTITPGETITCSWGAGGAGGAASAATGTAGSAGSTTTVVGSFGTIRFTGGTGGSGGNKGGSGGTGASAAVRNGGVVTGGGTGATQQSTTGGTDGEFSPYALGGSFNSSYGSATTGGGGGGGGASFAAGGNGGAAAAAGISSPTAGSAGSQGSGGGGGGGSASAGNGGAGGNGGTGRTRCYILTWQ